MWTDLTQKRIKKQADANEERLQCLTEDYAALSRQISYVENAKSKNDIRRQLVSIQEEIGQVELEQQWLYSKLRSLSNESVRPATQQDKSPSQRASALAQKVRSRAPASVQERPSQTFHNKKARSLIFSSLSTRRWEYAVASGITIALSLWWTSLGRAGRLFADRPGTMPGDIVETLTEYGYRGGLVAAFCLSAFTIFQSYLRQRAITISLVRLFIYCTLGTVLGGLSWHLAELSINCQLNPYQCGMGAIRGSRICIALSLLALWIPLLLSRLRSH